MPRQVIPRNNVGQMDSEVVREIEEKCQKLADNLYQSFPNIDLVDLQMIAIRQFGLISAVTLLHEAVTLLHEAKEGSDNNA